MADASVVDILDILRFFIFHAAFYHDKVVLFIICIHHTKTVDKNGNTQKNTYDYQNRLTETAAKEKKTGKETKHSYTYRLPSVS